MVEARKRVVIFEEKLRLQYHAKCLYSARLKKNIKRLVKIITKERNLRPQRLKDWEKVGNQ